MATEEKTEQPTPRRRREAREKGQVATSVDLTRALGLVMIYLAWRFAGRGMAARTLDVVERWLQARATGDLEPEAVMAGYAAALPVLLAVLGPLLAAAVLGTVLAASAQTRGLLAPAALNPDLSRINPATGFKRLVSVRGGVATLKGIVKVAVVLVIAAWVLRSHAGDIVMMGAMALRPMMGLLLGIAGEMLVKCALTLLVLGAADYAFEWWDQEKSLRMTRQELKRELREEEGDPQIRSRRRELQRGLLQQGITVEMPQADVVVTNPVHYAVALRYQPREMPAPKVVAKGQRAVAREIVRLARTYGIPVEEDPPVARSLFGSCALGEFVPEQLYQVVAEIFAAVYRRRRAQAAARPR